MGDTKMEQTGGIMLDMRTHDFSAWVIVRRMSQAALLTLGQRCKSLRQQMGLGVDDAAAAIGISRSSLSVIENGHDLPGRERLFAIANFYGVSTEYLRYGVTPVATPQSGDLINGVDEAAWMAFWRDMSDRERGMMLGTLKALRQNGAPDNGDAAA